MLPKAVLAHEPECSEPYEVGKIHETAVDLHVSTLRFICNTEHQQLLAGSSGVCTDTGKAKPKLYLMVTANYKTVCIIQQHLRL